jgi:hypothetical protein
MVPPRVTDWALAVRVARITSMPSHRSRTLDQRSTKHLRRAAGALAFVTACNGSSSAPDGAPSLVHSKVAVLAIAVATGGEGHAFFDNFITCPRRGVIDYINTPVGRLGTFSGCDAGDGVIVDGTAEVRWVNGGDRSRIARVEVIGTLRVRGPDGAEVVVDRLSASGVSFTSPTEPAVSNLIVAPVRVSASGTTSSLDARAHPSNVFPATGRGIDAIPNPAGTLDVLTEADLKSIAFGNGMRLARLLFDETLESQRGQHEHQLPCGTIRVSPEPTTQLVRIENAWSACDLGGGIIVSGAFTQRWTVFDGAGGRLAMVIEGQPVLGGNVPRVALSRLEWSITALASPGAVRISGKLVTAFGERTFAFEVVTDD